MRNDFEILNSVRRFDDYSDDSDAENIQNVDTRKPFSNQIFFKIKQILITKFRK